MSIADDAGVVFDLPEVNVDTLAAFIRERALKQSQSMPEQLPAPTQPALVQAPPAVTASSNVIEGEAPLARSLLSLGGYLDVLHSEMATIHEWLRLDTEHSSRDHQQTTSSIERLDITLQGVTRSLDQVNTRLSGLEDGLRQVSEAVQRLEREPAPSLPITRVERFWSRLRGGGK